MKPIINRKDVERVIEDLRKAGKKPTIAAIHAGLGGRGSITTVLKLKAEIDADTLVERDNAAALSAFREFWEAAVGAGRKESEAEIDQLASTIQALASENQALEGASTAAADAIHKVEAQRDELMLQVSEGNKLLTAARANADQYAQQLTSLQEKMESLRSVQALEIAEVREDLHREQERNRGLEIKLGQAEAHLEECNKTITTARANADQHAQQLAATQEKMEALRSAHSHKTAELREALQIEKDRNRDLEIKLVRAEALKEIPKIGAEA